MNKLHTLLPEVTTHSAASTADWAFNELFRRIVQRELQPGARVTEIELCNMLGVSRTPLRAAIQRLQIAGLVIRHRNRELRIAPMSVDEMVRLSMLREVLEGLVARNVATRFATGKISLKRLEKILDDMTAIDPTKGVPLILNLGREFHRELSELSGDPLTARMLGQVMMSFERYRHLVDFDTDRAVDILLEHQAIMATIMRGDGDAAEREARKHLRNARAVYSQRLSIVTELSGELTQKSPIISMSRKSKRAQ